MRAFVYPVRKIMVGGEKYDVHQTPRGADVYYRSRRGSLRRLSRPQAARVLMAHHQERELHERRMREAEAVARSRSAPARARRASLWWRLRRWLARVLRRPRNAPTGRRLST